MTRLRGIDTRSETDSGGNEEVVEVKQASQFGTCS